VSLLCYRLQAECFPDGDGPVSGALQTKAVDNCVGFDVPQFFAEKPAALFT
jgi:hypothetical protein